MRKIVPGFVVLAVVAGGVGWWLLRPGFSLDGPPGWEKKTHVMGTEVIYLSPTERPGDLFHENINVAVEKLPRGMDLDAYLKPALEMIGKMLNQVSIDESRRVELGGRPAQRVTYRHKMGQFDLKVLTYVVVKGQRAYIVTCTAQTDTFARYVDAFEGSCATLRVR